MSLLRRLFSSEFRRAVAEEATGNFIAAARSYALCGEPRKVVDMHLAQAQNEPEPEDRIRELRLAIRFSDEADQRRPMVQRLLGKALEQHGQALGDQTTAGREALSEAAEVYGEAEQWEKAGDCLLLLGDRQGAADAYSHGGLVDRVEAVLGDEERTRQRRREEHAAFADHELALQQGRPDDAADALRRCIEAARDKAQYRRLLADLEARLLCDGRVRLRAGGRAVTLVGRFPVLLGRDADCDIPVRAASVSRVHARLLRTDDSTLSIEDAGSRNGTLLAGLTIGAAVPLPDEGLIGLGAQAELTFHRVPGDPPLLRLEVSKGLEPGRTSLVCQGPLTLDRIMDGAPPLVLEFVRGRPTVHLDQGGLTLNGGLCGGPIQVIRGDRLEVDERFIDVV